MKINLLTVMALAVMGTSAYCQDVFGAHENLGLNTVFREGGSCIQPDGLSLYFHSNREGGQGETDLWVAKRTSVASAWQAPVNLGPTINTVTNEYNPSLSPDGLVLYFSSDRPGGYGEYDLWVSVRASEDKEWGEAINLGASVNSQRSEISPSISRDGLQLFFSDLEGYIPRTGGIGDSDLWLVSRSATSAAWGKPVNLGPVVNSAQTDVNPILSHDGLMLFFSSDRGGGQGWNDIWVSSRPTTDAEWGVPKNPGPGVNCKHDDNYLCMSTDYTMLYLCSARYGGKGGGDIWQIPVVSATGFLEFFGDD